MSDQKSQSFYPKLGERELAMLKMMYQGFRTKEDFKPTAEEKQKILKLYEPLRVTDVRDGLDCLGYHHYCSVSPEIRPLWRTKAVGFARTGRYLPFEGPAPVERGDEYLKWFDWYSRNVCFEPWQGDVEPGDFLCFDISGVDVGMIGSMNALAAKNHGAVGFLLNGGGIRDTDEVIAEQIPVWTKFISKGMNNARLRFLEYNVPIAIGGVAIYPGDLIVADGDGVIVVPQKQIYAVADYAWREMSKDRVLRRDLYEAGGMTPDASVDTSILE